MRLLSDCDKLRIIKLYPNTRAEDLATMFSVSKYCIYTCARKAGIKKDPEWIRQNSRENFHENHPGKKYWIKPGTVPPNKGKKIEEYMSEEQILKVKKTTFKKGNRPPNTAKVGDEVSFKGGYIKVKIRDPNKWKFKHHILWEAHYGKIPKGYNIQFKDKNNQNITIENLYMISRSDQLKLENSMYSRYPESIIKNINAIANLTRTINRRKKNEK